MKTIEENQGTERQILYVYIASRSLRKRMMSEDCTMAIHTPRERMFDVPIAFQESLYPMAPDQKAEQPMARSPPPTESVSMLENIIQF